VLRSKWAGPKDSIGTRHTAAGVGTGKQTILCIGGCKIIPVIEQEGHKPTAS
jgi:hypothetical protein